MLRKTRSFLAQWFQISHYWWQIPDHQRQMPLHLTDNHPEKMTHTNLLLLYYCDHNSYATSSLASLAPSSVAWWLGLLLVFRSNRDKKALFLPRVGNTQYLKIVLILSNIEHCTRCTPRQELKTEVLREACFHSGLLLKGDWKLINCSHTS